MRFIAFIFIFCFFLLNFELGHQTIAPRRQRDALEPVDSVTRSRGCTVAAPVCTYEVAASVTESKIYDGNPR
jgi:hypothetical protein